LDGRTLNHQSSASTVSPSSSSTLTPVGAGVRRAHGGRARRRVVDLAVDLAGRDVAGVVLEQPGQRPVLTAERGEQVQRGSIPESARQKSRK
jgi:hypothetical protein